MQNQMSYQLAMVEASPKSVGLGGDGDEVSAINDVERAFGVKLDYSDAPNWVTAGDVFSSLKAALPQEEREKPDLWRRFSAALCEQTGVNPEDIEDQSPLLSESRLWAGIADASAILWILAAVAFLGLLGFAFI
jgi:hypothetical protein